MRLKSLEMQGFKSFADRTVINFDHGVTIVVGPNGSGKSNISDAVRWVLGEMSSKNIRGSKMEDVIFGGTNNRQPMSFAEVSLTFDNTDPENRIDSEYSEITVTRRYHRSGDSEYLINRKAVRLKDITELFLNTGIGKNGYSIVSQGNIAAILSQKSEDRRTIFEEAAGISKYRYKKIEAERNLHAAEENLVRITDINSELESRIGPLESESKKAQQYLELYESKKITDVAVWTYDISNIKSKFDEVDLKYKLSKDDYEDSEAELAALEKKSEDAFAKSQENKYKSEQASVKISEINEKLHNAESEIRVLQNDISYINAQSEQMRNDASEQESARTKAENDIAALKEELSADQAKFADTLIEQDANNKEISALQTDSEAAETEISLKRQQAADIQNEIVNQKLSVSALEGSHSSNDARVSEISFEITENQESLKNLAERIEKSEESSLEYSQKVEKFSSQKAALAKERDGYAESLEAEKTRISEMDVEINTKRHRADTLKRMEELFEGYSNSVRAVMKAADEGKISGICGPVSRIISADGKYSVAIETSLGANIQNIVTENESAAKSAIYYLKNSNAGRATFYPLTSVKPTPLNIQTSELKREDGYVGIASELVSYDKKYSPVIEYLLGKTVIFDNIENASVVAKKNGFKFRIATLDGQLINAGGSYTGGSVRRDSGMLTRNTEIDTLQKQIAKLEAEKSKTAENVSLLLSKIKNTEASMTECDENAALVNVLLSAEQTQSQILKNECENVQKRLEALDTEMLKLGSDKESFNSEFKKLSEKIALSEKSLKDKELEIAEAESKKADISAKLSEAYDKNNSLLLRASEEKNLIFNCQKEISSLDELLQNIGTKIADTKANLEMTAEKLRSISEKIAADEEKQSSLKAEAEECENERKVLNAETEKCEMLISELRVKIKDCTHKRESLFQVFTKLEAAREKVMGEQDMLTSKLWDEYEMTYSSALEFDKSGICEENYREFTVKQNELKSKLKRLGPVNVNAIAEYKEVKERYEFLSAQIDDLTSSRENLLGIISKLEKEMQVKFTETFEQINTHFKRVFKELFGGGHAELVLTDPSDSLNSGVEINVAPPGKVINNINLLSGGEKAFVAIALFFAILNVNPSPFCILDEIESALDEVNVGRFAEYSKYYSGKTQFIIITHRRGTMESADTLYGVTMRERGISTVLSIDINDAEKKMGVKME